MGDLRVSMAAGRGWLERHAAYLLPDALVFAEIGLRAAGMRHSPRLHPRRAGRAAQRLVPLSPAFRTVAAAAGPLYHGYRGPAPLVAARRAQRRRLPSRRASGSLVPSLDGATINRALAECVGAGPSPESLRWMRRPGQSDFVLTHQLLTWLLYLWNRGPEEATRRIRRLGDTVRREADRLGAYHDLLAQQTAFLALGGWPSNDLRPLIARILADQDARDGGWHYFETNTLDAAAVLGRVACGWSPLIGLPVAGEERHLGRMAATLRHVHRAHATALSLCALGVTARRRRDSTPSAR